MKITTLASIAMLPLYVSAFNINSNVWIDANQDWERNNGEVGYENATLELYDEDSVKIKTTTSDNKGNYQFNNLVAGEYAIKVLKPTNTVIVTTAKRELWLETDRNDITFGLLPDTAIPTYKINSIVWNDRDQDWEKNHGEIGLPNVTIEAYSNGQKVQTTTSGTNGAYELNNLPAGEYIIKAIVPKDAEAVTLLARELYLETNRADMDFGMFKRIINENQDFLIYEDAEDSSIDRWTISVNGTGNAKVTNIEDTAKSSRVIKLQSSDSYEHEYKLNFANNQNFNLKWDMKTTEGFIIDVLITTEEGERRLRYNDLDNTSKDTDTLIYGLGYTPTNGNWNTISRNLQADVEALEPNNKILSVDTLLIRANCTLDNIELFNSAIKIYEDAQTGNTNNWSIYSGDDTAKITNINDNTLNSKIIQLKGKGFQHQYIIGGDYIGEENSWNDKRNTNIQWKINSTDNFIVSVVLNTSKGVRYINYMDIKRKIQSIEGDTLQYGLGNNTSNGQWHTHIRDLSTDLKKLEPTNTLLSVEGVIISGSLKIDDLELFRILHPNNNKAGVALTFDDTTIDSWFKLRPMFKKYNAKATFFISHFYGLEATQINQLKILEQEGSEIGAHSHDHKGVTKDFNDDITKIPEYIEEQIKGPYDLMKNAGFNPVSFAYPYGEHHPEYDKAVRKFFPYIRLTHDDLVTSLPNQTAIYHDSNSNYNLLAGAGIDKDFNNSIEEIIESLIKARKNGKIITLYGHDVIDDENKQYNIVPEKLGKIMKNARNLGLKFYTYKKAFQVGNKN